MLCCSGVHHKGIGKPNVLPVVLLPGLKHYDELPGPTELPFIRSLLQVYMGPRPQINKLWTRIARTHGPLCKCARSTIRCLAQQSKMLPGGTYKGLAAAWESPQFNMQRFLAERRII